MRALFEGFAAGDGGASRPLAADSLRGRLGEIATGIGERNTG
jgi:hypothetical protein